MLFQQFKVKLVKPFESLTVGKEYTVVTACGWSKYVIDSNDNHTVLVPVERFQVDVPEAEVKE